MKTTPEQRERWRWGLNDGTLSMGSGDILDMLDDLDAAEKRIAELEAELAEAREDREEWIHAGWERSERD